MTQKEKDEVEQRITQVVSMIHVEVLAAMEKHPKFPTAHHGHSVIREELEELWEHVRKDTGQLGPAKREAIQVAAMAVRYILDLC